MPGSWKRSLRVPALFLLIAGCGLWQDTAIPPALYGAWETADPRYEGCYLEISPSLLVFHGKDGGLDINHIRRIKKAKGNPPQIHIQYKSKEQMDYTLKVLFDDSATPPRLQFVTSKTLAWTPRRPHGT